MPDAKPQIEKVFDRRKIVAGMVTAVTTVNYTLGCKLAMADTVIKMEKIR